jgi:hypothetical protein
MLNRHTLAATLVWLALIQPALAENDVAQDVTHLERLIAEIEKLVPAGWDVELDLAAPGPGGLRPVLTITTGEKVSMKWNIPGQAFRAEGQPDKNIKQEHVELRLAFMTRLTPEEHAAARRRNEERYDRRRQFVKEHLSGVSYSGKVAAGHPAAPPWSFETRSETETRRVREYAFLWLATEPENLPSHRYGTLSMWYRPPPILIYDEKWSREYDQIVDGMGRLLTPYEDVDTRSE